LHTTVTTSATRPDTRAKRVLVEGRGLAVGWGRQAILENVDVEVEEGAVLALLGGSGSGKSTLLRHLVGFEAPLAGEVRWNVAGRPGIPEEAPRFGILFQSGALFGSSTLLQNVALPLERWTDLGPAAIAAVARAKLRLVGLDGFENHLPSEISGGMKKRAGIARALALDPPLLFLDEPSAGLDPVTSAELDELLLTLNRHLGTTLVLVTHELVSLHRVATDCLMLDRDARTVIARGSPGELADTSTDPRVRAFFHPGGRRRT
jgi:phospholipid/cholesterol/gamma-HCH transport system ATP-binding protein